MSKVIKNISKEIDILPIHMHSWVLKSKREMQDLVKFYNTNIFCVKLNTKKYDMTTSVKSFIP